MKKKVFLSLLVIANTLPLVSVPATLITLGYALPNVYEESFLGELKYKYDLLTSTNEKKIVFIGGSSIPFGIRSSYIENYFKSNLNENYKVVDFGMYAALGTKVMLDLAKNHLNKDDIVIISPEQQEQTLSLYFNGKYMWQALDGRVSLYKEIAKENKPQMVGDYIEYIQNKIELLSYEIDYSNDIYCKASFDKYGDISSSLCEYNTMSNYYDENMMVSFDDSVISSDFIDYLNEFNLVAKKKGVTTYYRFSPMNKLACVGDINSYYDYLSNQLDFEILGNPNNAIMDYEYFFDSNFHLNNTGALLNTLNIIEELKVIYNDSIPYNIEIPNKPIIPTGNISDGNNSMLNYFNILKLDEKAIIKELTNKEIKEVIIPYSIDNVVIESFDEAVFVNNSKIKTITIQNNIRSIPSNAFSGCSSLESIIIYNDKPSSIIPYGDILNNTNATIYVPKNAISSYKTNYFWSLYASRIKVIEGDNNL